MHSKDLTHFDQMPSNWPSPTYLTQRNAETCKFLDQTGLITLALLVFHHALCPLLKTESLTGLSKLPHSANQAEEPASPLTHKSRIISSIKNSTRSSSYQYPFLIPSIVYVSLQLSFCTHGSVLPQTLIWPMVLSTLVTVMLFKAPLLVVACPSLELVELPPCSKEYSTARNLAAQR